MAAYDTVSLQITYKNRPKPGGKQNLQIWGPMGPHLGPMGPHGEPMGPMGPQIVNFASHRAWGPMGPPRGPMGPRGAGAPEPMGPRAHGPQGPAPRGPMGPQGGPKFLSPGAHGAPSGAHGPTDGAPRAPVLFGQLFANSLFLKAPASACVCAYMYISQGPQGGLIPELEI